MEELTAVLVKELREVTGAGMMEIKRAFLACNNDRYLTQGYLKYMGLAVHIKGHNGMTDAEAYHQWVMNRAHNYANELREKAKNET